MSPIVKLFTSSVGKKYVMSLTGLALVGFVVAHLAGNLQLLIPSEYFFNKYAHHLEAFGPFLWAAELGLIAIAGLHAAFAVALNIGYKNARPEGYQYGSATKGGPSKSNLSSRHMLVLGLFILGFIVVHVWQFKYGNNIEQGYTFDLQGAEVRDLYRLVDETFENPLWVGFYTISMIILGLHLRHGIWSAFQSLGVMPGPISKGAYLLGVIISVLLAIGFLFLPIAMYLNIPQILQKMVTG